MLSTWTIDFILSVFDALFGQEGEGIMSQLTMDTLILLMIYFSLSVTLIGKRKAVLGNLIHYYEAWIMKEYRVRVQVQLNLLARCYHEQLLTKDWSYESLTIDIPRDKDILPGIISNNCMT